MLFYILLFIFVIAPFICLKNHKKASIVSFLILWFVYAFRNRLAIDDEGYILAYERINSGWNYVIEWTFQAIAKITNAAGFNYKLLFFLYASVSFIFLYRSFDILFNNKREKMLFLATFMGYEFVATISVMRQFLASSICFYALLYLYKNKKMVFPIALCTIALLFHGGAIISFPLIFIFYKKWKITYSQKVFFIILCVLIGYSGLPTLVIEKVLTIFSAKYLYYLDNITGSFSSAGGTVSLIMLFMFLFQCFISLRSKTRTPQDEMIDIIEKGQLVYLGLLFILVKAGVASRLSFTFIPYAATIPYTFIARFKPSNRRVLTVGMIFFMFLLFVMTMNELKTSNYGTFFPYTWSMDFVNSVK